MASGERQRTPEGATAVGVVIIAAPSAAPEGIASTPKPTI